MTGSFSHIPIGYIIACLTSGAISKQEAVTATVEGDFSSALTRMHQKDFSLEEAVLPVLPTEFGKNVNCNHRRTMLCVRDEIFVDLLDEL